LQQFVGQHETEWAMLMAASTLMTLPIILLLYLAQRFFIQGITLTGIKG
jgi:multiple sugar transport system permease protein